MSNSSLFPRNPNLKDFNDFTVDEFVNMKMTSIPPARDRVQELLDDPETMNILEELVEVARKTRGHSARTLLSNWKEVQEMNRKPNGFVRK